MATIEWRPPAPTWTSGTIGGGDARRAALVQCEGDNFLPDFLDLMEGRAPGQTPKALADQLLKSSASPQKLFLPAHGRYYLVAGSLVCRQLGLPDRTVARAAGEKTSFVVRRLQRDAKGQFVLDAAGRQVEEAWVNDGPGKGWHVVADRAALFDGEERLPLHHVDTCAAYDPGASAFADAFGLSRCGGRTVYYGYIPVGSRDKYAERYRPPAPATPAAELQAFVDEVRAFEPGHDPRLDEVDSRVLAPWRSLTVDPLTGTPLPGPQKPTGKQLQTASLFLLLDIADVLRTNLPSVYAALGSAGNDLTNGSARKNLFNQLWGIKGVSLTDTSRRLTDILGDLKSLVPLVQEDADASAITDEQIDQRADDYDMTKASGVTIDYLKSPEQKKDLPAPDGMIDTLHEFFSAALEQEKNERVAAGLPWMPAPSVERLSLLRDQVVPPRPGEDVYTLRLVYEHAPCAAVLSEPSLPVTFAKFYDPDAPARHIRIELPSIKPRDLRKYKRGVGLEMSPELRDLMNRIHKGLLKDEGLAGSDGGWTIGMICSFSLQIIFLVAFIVMFIFLILLNIIFWWLAFLKICFPIPKKTG